MRRRFLVLLLATITIVSAVLAVVLMSQWRDNDAHWKQLLTVASQKEYATLSDRIDDQLSNVTVLGHVRSVIQAASTPSMIDAVSFPGEPTVRERVLNVFQSALTNYVYTQIMIVSITGKPLVSLSAAEESAVPRLASLVAAVAAARKARFIDVFSGSRGTRLIGYLAPIHDLSGHPVGAVVALADPAVVLFHSLTVPVPVMQTGEVMILCRDSDTSNIKILYQTDEEESFSLQALLSLYQAPLHSTFVPVSYENMSGTLREGIVQYVPASEWTIVTGVQKSETKESLVRTALIEAIATFSVTSAALFTHNSIDQRRERSLLLQNAKNLAVRNGEVLRLNRLLQVTRATNQLISHETPLEELLPGVCRQLVETGGFLSAAVIRSEETSFRLVAHAGKAFQGISENGSLPDIYRERVCIAHVFERRQTIYMSSSDRSVCRSCGNLSKCPAAETVVIPVINGDELYGVLVVRGQTVNTIGKEERASLQELSSDIAFALRSQTMRAQKKAADDALRQSQKMEAVGQLAGGVAHDFNNLLTSIIGNVGLAINQTGQDAETVRTLTDAVDAARRAANLTRNLLAFSRKTVIRPEVTDMDRVIDQALVLLSRSLPPTIRIVRNRSAEPWYALVDTQQMTQMLVNLAINARDAMHDTGMLTISTSHRTLHMEEASPGHRAGDYIAIAVEDTGEGMTPEVRSHIFEPFFTTKPPGHGTGLGLSMAYSAVEQAGGWFEIDTEAGRGSIFRFLLPRCQEELAVQKEVVPTLDTLAGGHETILLIDDEESLRTLGRRILMQWGYGVLTAADGAEGVDLFKKHQEEVDLVICDLTMPGMSGMECLAMLKHLQPDMPVLLSSGYSEEAGIAGLIGGAGGAAGFLAKPYTVQEILVTIRRILDTQQIVEGRTDH